MQPQKPYISSEQTLPELTVKAILLGALLSMILAAANAYFGLFAGMTVSASIPAAVISMAVLRMFRNANILENNLVQTAASAGESIAAGVIFTIPALIIMGYWKEFNYWETTFIAMAGGILGVLFTIPLRKALIVREKLMFPEGIATSEVLKTGTEAGNSIKYLVWGGLLGAVMKLSEGALNLWDSIFETGTYYAQKVYLYFGLNLSPALVAVGYIVGLNISLLIFIGGAISWYVAIPLYLALNGAPADAGTAVEMGASIWNSQIRYLGVGAMVVGGFWALISIRGALGLALKSGVQAFKKSGESQPQLLRTERDTPMVWVLVGILVMIFPIYFIYYDQLHLGGVTAFMALIMIIAGFLFSAVAGYMAGLVGSSNNPISGVTIATILFSSLMLLLLLDSSSAAQGAAGAILIGGVVACAAAIAGDNMQDLKAGYILGATPFKQQIMQIVGVVAGAIVIAPVLNSLLTAYGIGAATEAHPDALSAPQATLMQSVADGIFGGGLPWDMVGAGAVIAVIIIAIDQYQKSKNRSFRVPVLAVAVGMYLPLDLDTSILLGGLIAWLTERFMKNKGNEAAATKAAANRGLLFASGLITGEALTGIGIAVAIVAGGGNLSLFKHAPLGAIPGVLVLLGIGYGLYRLIIKAYQEEA